jgi:excisionase family DNA binding protein
MSNHNFDRERRTLISATETASRLGLKPATIRRWVRNGSLPAIRLGGRTLRFDMDAIVSSGRLLDARKEDRDE